MKAFQICTNKLSLFVEFIQLIPSTDNTVSLSDELVTGSDEVITVVNCCRDEAETHDRLHARPQSINACMMSMGRRYHKQNTGNLIK